MEKATDTEKKKRAVYLMGDIDETKSETFIKTILELELQDPTKDIVVIIDSYGGQVDAMWAMHDAMNMVACKVHTLCIGKAMSCGQLILIGGTKGCRYATPNSRIAMHEITSFTCGKISDMQNHAKEMDRIDKQFKKYIVSKTKLTQKQLEAKIKHDFYMSAKEALKFGFIDKIIKSFSEIKLKGW